jgi:hypothetical protein
MKVKVGGEDATHDATTQDSLARALRIGISVGDCQDFGRSVPQNFEIPAPDAIATSTSSSRRCPDQPNIIPAP